MNKDLEKTKRKFSIWLEENYHYPKDWCEMAANESTYTAFHYHSEKVGYSGILILVVLPSTDSEHFLFEYDKDELTFVDQKI